jgi:hypothetical protein
VNFFLGGRRSAGGKCTGLSRDFGTLVAYLTRGSQNGLEPNRVAWISCRNLDGVDEPARAAQVMRAHAGEHRRAKRPVYHFGISLRPAEHLSPEQWQQAVEQVLERLGLGRHQALIVAHGDTGREHVHVVVNRVRDDGPAWHRDFDRAKALDAVTRIATAYGLVGAGDSGLPALSANAYLAARHTSRQPLCDRVRDEAAVAFAEAAGWQDLEARLADRGFRLAPAARKPGLLVTDGSHYASLSQVDRSLSGPKLARRFGETFDDHRLAHPEPRAVLAPARQTAAQPTGGLELRAAELLDRITLTRATFAESDLRRGAFYQPDSAALIRAALSSDRVLDLGKGAGRATRYTTREYLDAEAHLLAAAASLSSRHHHRLDPVATGRAPAGGFERSAPAHELAADAGPVGPAGGLAAGAPAVPDRSGDRRAAVLHATTAPDLVLIVGTEDAARTAAAGDVAAAYQERGYEVRGTAVTARTAAALETAGGIRSVPLASLESAWSRGADPLHPRSVLFVEEAGMLDVRRLGRILDHAEERHAKVVLLGDPDRRQTIGAGDAFRGLLEHYPSASLDAQARQRDSSPSAAGKQLAGRASAGGKDLAGDYAAAELRRAAAQLQHLAAETHRVILEERPLREALAALSSLRDARLHVVESRRSVARTASLVYTDPANALRGLLRDPEAPARLRRGGARFYGKLHGGIGLGAPRRERATAFYTAEMTLAGRLDGHQRTIAGLQAAKETARAKSRPLTAPSVQAQTEPRALAAARGLDPATARHSPPSRRPGTAQIRSELARVTAALGACRQATNRAQDALEAAVRGMGRATVAGALLLLPPKLAPPVEVAIRAVARVLDLGLDLGLGR